MPTAQRTEMVCAPLVESYEQDIRFLSRLSGNVPWPNHVLEGSAAPGN